MTAASEQRSVTVDFLLRDPAPERESRCYAECADDPDIAHLLSWLHDPEERLRLRNALAHDAFEFHGDWTHYRSEDRSTMYFWAAYKGRPPERRLPRPPLVEILCDWDAFLATEDAGQKTYKWDVIPALEQPYEVVLHFGFDQKRDRPMAYSADRDIHRQDRFRSLFLSLGRGRGLSDVAAQPTFTWYGGFVVVRATEAHVELWADDGEPGDFLLVARDEFDQMLRDWHAYCADPTSQTRTYSVRRSIPRSWPHLRDAARGLLLDPDDRVLMVDLHHELNGWRGWILPGGGLEPGESSVAGLRRELHEEVGLVDAPIGPKVAVNRKISPGIASGFDGQEEPIYLVRCDAFDPTPAMSEAELRSEGVVGHRWFSVAELRAEDRTIAPPGLAELIERVITHGGLAEPLVIESSD